MQPLGEQAIQTASSEYRDVLVDVRDLKTYFKSYRGLIQAVDGVSFTIRRSKNLGVLGESGCGKSVTALSVMGLIRQPPGQLSGEIRYHRRDDIQIDLLTLDPRSSAYREIRGGEIAMIFQEPMTSLNPVYSVGNQIVEAIRLHQGVNKKAAYERAVRVLDQVGLPNPDKVFQSYPHQLSGGMRQRAMIAMALSCNPSLLIADEPTTALDVTIAAQILDLLKQLQREFNTSIMIITHDMGVIAQMSDEVMVMYLGQVVEYGTVRDIFKAPMHPYTRGLLQSIPQLGPRAKEDLVPIEGSVLEPINLPPGCRFADRCPARFHQCAADPPLFQLGELRQVRCWLYEADATEGNHVNNTVHDAG
jgi:peptide/nickel transport system ATP-binding protein